MPRTWRDAFFRTQLYHHSSFIRFGLIFVLLLKAKWNLRCFLSHFLRFKSTIYIVWDAREIPIQFEFYNIVQIIICHQTLSSVTQAIYLVKFFLVYLIPVKCNLKIPEIWEHLFWSFRDFGFSKSPCRRVIPPLLKSLVCIALNLQMRKIVCPITSLLFWKLRSIAESSAKQSNTIENDV